MPPADAHTYDDFQGPGIDESRWMLLEMPTGADGPPWRCEEPGARTTVGGGTAEIEVPRFARAHDQVQIFDNPKHLWLSTGTFAPPDHGSVTFSVDMAAERLGDGDATDYRFGVASFHVLDMESGWVFDHLATGARSLALYERLPVPAATDPGPFTYVVDNTFGTGSTTPGGWRTYGVRIEPATRTLTWLVDGAVTYQVRQEAPLPASFRLGLGLLTLCPLDGGSRSLRGQGMRGRWRDVRVTTTG